MQDISDKKLFENNVQESAARLALVGKVTTDGIWDWDLRGMRVFGPDMQVAISSSGAWCHRSTSSRSPKKPV